MCRRWVRVLAGGGRHRVAGGRDPRLRHQPPARAAALSARARRLSIEHVQNVSPRLRVALSRPHRRDATFQFLKLIESIRRWHKHTCVPVLYAYMEKPLESLSAC